MTRPIWKSLTTAQRDEIVRPAWVAGQSASEIAAMFEGATRNSVIGRVTRGKFGARETIIRPKTERKPRPERKPKPVRIPMAKPAFVSFLPDQDMPSQSVMDMINNNRVPLAGTTPIDILALPNRPGVRCRFPVDGGYCGAACGDKMYCKAHHAVMYRPHTEKMRVPREARL